MRDQRVGDAGAESGFGSEPGVLRSHGGDVKGEKVEMGGFVGGGGG